MGRAKALLQRRNDTRMINIEIELDFSEKFDYASISFKCHNELEILATSVGHIQSNSIEVMHVGLIECQVEYSTSSNVLECLVGYYSEGVLIHHESILSDFDNQRAIEDISVDIPELKTVLGSFEDRLVDFKQTLRRTESSLHANVQYDEDDVLITFLSNRDKTSFLSFGEDSEEILASDYIFSVIPETKVLHIPKEIIKSSGTRLSLWELVRPDFLSVSNVYYKVPVSEKS